MKEFMSSCPDKVSGGRALDNWRRMWGQHLRITTIRHGAGGYGTREDFLPPVLFSSFSSPSLETCSSRSSASASPYPLSHTFTMTPMWAEPSPGARTLRAPDWTP